ncbi:aminotransferase class I/II-fold pyridoxal phosphate-dependent enzyme [Streptomyces sp. TS71-3]|uniref:aminotransferase class I/II-fold pyridoxal phosphate-dependent enzyme n=1 Tax=Streptomyces sp. TS71-3 TaxID=2733862 RepID=UPI001B104D35|nr:aminotransferase class I/II-fold pyridoxal phosphate-dependent enzyme [Streptomyces sp. TS71-3]GHJ41438.1 aminopeptidase [Streptomyces sp. TS71-3]
MRMAVHEGRGSVRQGPDLPDPALPVLPELTAAVATAAARTAAEPTGGGPELLDAAAGYWARRGLPAEPRLLAAAPGAPLLLLAVCAALGGDVLVPRPCSAWWAPGARALDRAVFPVATPAECGGVPDPYALLEAVRRVRAEGGRPRVLVLSVADDPTATVPPPEVLHEAVEAAMGEGLHIISDETLRDTLHQPARPDPVAPRPRTTQRVPLHSRGAGGGTGTGQPASRGPGAGGLEQASVVVSPAEMVPDGVTVIADLAGAFLPAGWPAAVARFADTDTGRALRARSLDVLTAAGGRIAAPIAAAATLALAEPEEVRARLATAARLHARVAGAAHRMAQAVGVLARPPQAGRHLYADLAPLRPALAARGVRDAQELEDFLTERLGVPAPGGHRFGDDLAALRVRLSTGPLLGTTPEQRAAALAAPDPLALPHVAVALAAFASAFGDLRNEPSGDPDDGAGATGGPHGAPPAQRP